MKASEYIDKLQALIDKHGDLECIDTYENLISDPEECEGDFVLAKEAE